MIEQGTDGWHAQRLGKVTASRFKDVLTVPRSKAAREAGDLSGSALIYLRQIIASVYTGQPIGSDLKAPALDWGRQCEPIAAQAYATEIHSGLPLYETPFIDHPEQPHIGGSPDRLVGDHGLLEIKCPYQSQVHLETVMSCSVPAQHLPQIQGLLWITERKWCDFVSFDPRLRTTLGLYCLRVYRDEKYIADLEVKVCAFRDRLRGWLANLDLLQRREWTLPDMWTDKQLLTLSLGGKELIL